MPDELTKVGDVSDQYNGDATLYKTDGPKEIDGVRDTHESEYWVVSSVTGTVGGTSSAMLNSFAGRGMTNHVDETMVFEATEDGEMSNNTEVVCVKPADENEAVDELENLL